MGMAFPRVKYAGESQTSEEGHADDNTVSQLQERFTVVQLLPPYLLHESLYCQESDT